MNLKSRLKSFRDGVDPIFREARFTLDRMKGNLFSIVGIIIVIFFVGIALMAPVIAPPEPGSDPYILRIREDWKGARGLTPPPTPPSPDHPFGTLGGYDIYYGCIWGTRTAFRIGWQVVGISLAIAMVVGSISGYYGGLVDEFVMRFTDIIYAFPGLILAMALVVAFGRSLDSVLLALVLVGWPTYTRVVRGEIFKVKQEDYVEAAKAVGCSDLRVILRHVLPNSIYPVLIMASLNIGAIVLTAAALSFLGLGAGESFADWGQLISNSRDYIMGTATDPLAYWHTWLIPGLFIFTFVLGWNLLGDAFRDILDPTIRRR